MVEYDSKLVSQLYEAVLKVGPEICEPLDLKISRDDRYDNDGLYIFEVGRRWVAFTESFTLNKVLPVARLKVKIGMPQIMLEILARETKVGIWTHMDAIWEGGKEDSVEAIVSKMLGALLQDWQARYNKYKENDNGSNSE